MFPYMLPDEVCLLKQHLNDLQTRYDILEKSVQTIMTSLVEITEAVDSLRPVPATDGQPEAVESIPEAEKLSDGETAPEAATAPKPARKVRAKRKDNSSSPTESHGEKNDIAPSPL